MNEKNSRISIVFALFFKIQHAKIDNFESKLREKKSDTTDDNSGQNQNTSLTWEFS